MLRNTCVRNSWNSKFFVSVSSLQGKFPLPPYLKPTVIFRQDGGVKFHSRPSGLELQVMGDAALAARVAANPDILLPPSEQKNRPARRQRSSRGVRQPPPKVWFRGRWTTDFPVRLRDMYVICFIENVETGPLSRPFR